VLGSIVVLPFENLSEDPEQEFFAAGMHDALITELAQISALRVISRTSAMAYKDRRVSVPQIARELNVDGILEASVFRVGDSVRIQAQLIQAFPEEGHLWAHTFDREMSDVLAMHSEVARAVAQEVEIGLTPQEENRLDSVRSVTPETYELYLKGMFHLNKLTPEGFEIGLKYLDQAVENDPGEPLPYGGLALGWAIIGHTPSPPPDALLKAEAFALRALELDDSLAEAHAALAEVRIYHDWDLEGAGQAFRRALDAPTPNSVGRQRLGQWPLSWRRVPQDGMLGVWPRSTRPWARRMRRFGGWKRPSISGTVTSPGSTGSLRSSPSGTTPGSRIWPGGGTLRTERRGREPS